MTRPEPEVLLPCDDLNAALAFFTERLEFQLRTIFPADAPRVALLDLNGLRVRLDAAANVAPPTLRLPLDLAEPLTAPGGTRIEPLRPESELHVPRLAPELLVQRPADAWAPGRAGMGYRDLLPGRLGGHTIASHIRIATGGPVPDYVHHHRVRFQVIYCHRGRVRVVYEDQGEPFWMEPGDCVLQPPGIRHRVLESSDGLEVIELGCPAEHETHADAELELPNGPAREGRSYGGQRFVRSRAEGAAWRGSGAWEVRDTGIDTATEGLASVRLLRPAGAGPHVLPERLEHSLRFVYVLSGSVELGLEAEQVSLETDACCALPPGLGARVEAFDPQLRLLEVTSRG